MKKKNFGLVLSAVFFCIMFSATASADTADIVAANRQVGAQYISTYVDYTETGNGFLGTRTGVLDTERGWVPGVGVSFSSMWGDHHFYINAQVSQNTGATQYVGSLQGGTYGSVVAWSTATLIDRSVRFGKGFAIKDSMMATPYAEVGMHEWDRGVNFGETYTHNYVGLGILGQYSPVTRLVISASALVGSTFASYISVAGPFGFSGDLGNSALYKAGLSVDYAFTRHFHGNAGIDYTRFSYGMSSPNTVIAGGFIYTVWEPDSSTRYTTARIGLGYSF